MLQAVLVIRGTVGQLSILFGLGGAASQRAALGYRGNLLGTLATYDTATHDFTVTRNYAAREDADPDGSGEINSNPFGIVEDGSGYAATDAGANVLWRDGSTTVFPTQLEQNPFAPPGVMVPQDAVPTSVVARPEVETEPIQRISRQEWRYDDRFAFARSIFLPHRSTLY